MSKSYTAPHPVYVESRYYKPGEVFTTDAKPGQQWEAVPDKAPEKPSGGRATRQN